MSTPNARTHGDVLRVFQGALTRSTARRVPDRALSRVPTQLVSAVRRVSMGANVPAERPFYSTESASRSWTVPLKVRATLLLNIS